MIAVRHARFIVGICLGLAPFACMAQEQAASTSGTTVMQGTGAMLMERLEALWDESTPDLAAMLTPTKYDLGWPEEVKRYAERSSELRTRCNEELRAANRDTIAAKSAQCLRADLLLEVAHRRKQSDRLENAIGTDPTIARDVVDAIHAWIDAATAVIDGADAGIFTTVDMLKEAKKNLHATYRAPMFTTIVRARASRALSLAEAIATSVRGAMVHPESDVTLLNTFVPCMENAHSLLATAQASTGTTSDFSSGVTALKECIEIVESAK